MWVDNNFDWHIISISYIIQRESSAESQFSGVQHTKSNIINQLTALFLVIFW